MTSRSPAFHHPVVFARFQRGLFERAQRAVWARRIAGFGRIIRQSAAVAGAGIRMLRSAPPLGDIGTRGGDLTRWIQGQIANDSNRE